MLRITCLLLFSVVYSQDVCEKSPTTASGTFAPKQFCSGDLIFEDDFDSFDLKKWHHENTLAGGGNWEFQWYTNNRSNSFAENGTLFIKPTLTSDTFGETFLTTGTLNLNGGAPADYCTNPSDWGCSRTGNVFNIINPVKSARIRTVRSFNFCYGRVEFRAKLPTGDWLWPAVWLLPRDNSYGLGHPSSGEIDILESRGNRNLTLNDANIGTQQVGSTLHWGPFSALNRYSNTTWSKTSEQGFDEDFHIYELLWTPNNISFSVDGEVVGAVEPPEGGFWELGGFANSSYDNPWVGGTKMAPFDEEFYLIVNLAVGGLGYFPDDAVNGNGKKPWSNKSAKASTDFWNGRESWLPTWKLNEGNSAAFQIDYVRIYAL